MASAAVHALTLLLCRSKNKTLLSAIWKKGLLIGDIAQWGSQALDIKRLPQSTSWHLPFFYSTILIFSLNGVRGRSNGVNVSPPFSDI